MTVSYKGKTIVLTPDQALASVAGRLVSLPAPPSRSGRRWLVPVEFISRALALIYDARLDLRKPSHLLVVGDLRVPRVTVRYDRSATPARLTIDATPRANATVIAGRRTPRRSSSTPTRSTCRSRRSLAATPGSCRPSALRRADDARGRPRSALRRLPRHQPAGRHDDAADDRYRRGADRRRRGRAAAGAAPPPPPPPPDLPPSFGQPASGVPHHRDRSGPRRRRRGREGRRRRQGKRSDAGRGAARQGAIEARLGIRVLLTRDDDRSVPVDERAAVANNNKADLFISLHANALVSARRRPARRSSSPRSIATRAQAATARRRAAAGVRRRLARHRAGALGPRADPPSRSVAAFAELLAAVAAGSRAAVRAAGRPRAAARARVGQHAGGAGRDGLPDQPGAGEAARRRAFQNASCRRCSTRSSKFRDTLPGGGTR